MDASLRVGVDGRLRVGGFRGWRSGTRPRAPLLTPVSAPQGKNAACTLGFPGMNNNSDRQVVFSGGIIFNVDLEVLNVRKPVKFIVLREKKKH